MSLFLCHHRKPIFQWTGDIWLNNVLIILAYPPNFFFKGFKFLACFGVMKISLIRIIGGLVGGGGVLCLLVLLTCDRFRQRIQRRIQEKQSASNLDVNVRGKRNLTLFAIVTK